MNVYGVCLNQPVCPCVCLSVCLSVSTSVRVQNVGNLASQTSHTVLYGLASIDWEHTVFGMSVCPFVCMQKL